MIIEESAILTQKNSLVRCFWTLLVFAFCCSGAMAKSLYVAGNSDNRIEDVLWVYDVQDDGTLVLQTTKDFPSYGNYGVNGIGVDPVCHTIFLTYKRFHHAGLVNSQTLEWQGLVYIPPLKMDPGAVVYDEIAARFYTTDVLASNEIDDRLLIYDWDPVRKLLLTYWTDDITWTGASSVPLARENAGALAFDKIYEVVYVAVKEGGVDAYKTSHERDGWQLLNSYDTAYEAQALTVDPTNQLIYTGGKMRNKGALIDRINLTDGTTFRFTAGGINEEVFSLSVNDNSSLLYALIGDSDASVRTIKVFDENFTLLESIFVAGDARQLLVPNSFQGYNPLNLTITPVSGVVQNNGNYVAAPGSQIEYEICLTNINPCPLTDITITSILDESLTYNGTSELGNAQGAYASQTRTFEYEIPFFDPRSTQCFSLFATVTDDALAASLISTTVAADVNDVGLSQDRVDVQVEFDALGLAKEVVIDPNFLVVGNKIYVDPGADVTYRICLNNLTNANAVTDVLLTDKLSGYVDFVSADSGGIAGFYDADLHTYSWVFESVEPNSTVCLDIRVRLKDDLSPGIVIPNQVLLDGRETDNSTTAGAIVVVKRKALVVNTTIKDSGDYDPVTNRIPTGGVLTFVIDVNNVDTATPAENIVVIDSASEGLQFFDSTGDVEGVYDPLTRTYTIEVPYLGPEQGIRSELTFIVDDHLPEGSVLSNSLIAMANGGPASDTSVSLSVYVPEEPNVPVALEVNASIKASADYNPVTNQIMRGGVLTFIIDVNNLDPANAAENIEIIDSVSEGLHFIAFAGNVSGLYDPLTRTYTIELPYLGPDQGIHTELTFLVDSDLAEGSMLSNFLIATANGELAASTWLSLSVAAPEEPNVPVALEVKTRIKDSGGYDPVTNQIPRGGELTFIIDVNNVDPANAAENIEITNSVSYGLYFSGSAGEVDGTYDALTRTHTIELPYLGPEQGVHSELSFMVDEFLPDPTIITNHLIARAHGVPESGTSVSLSVLPIDEPNVPIEPNEVSTTLAVYYNGPLLSHDEHAVLMVIMQFPACINLADIDTTRALDMTPGPSTAYHRDIAGGLNTNYFVFGLDGSVMVKGFFDRQPVLDALADGQETVTLTVTGRLKTMGDFVGQASVPVN